MDLKENSIVIFKNSKKQQEKQPDYTGKLNINGEIKDVSLWVKEGKSGKFFSGPIKEEWKPSEQPKNINEVPTPSNNDDDLPF
jgi:hypothetical protein